MSQLTFHGPLSQARAVQLTERLTRTGPRTVLDIGCERVELMLRILAAAPEATGIGIDLDEDDLARGRAAAQARGLAGRVSFIRESGIATTRGPADLVLSVGASQAITDVQPPGLDRDGHRPGMGGVRVGIPGRRGGVARRPPQAARR
jgi:predicted RNA methylase